MGSRYWHHNVWHTSKGGNIAVRNRQWERVGCPLPPGLSQTQTLRFVHFAKVNADFSCKFQDQKPTTFVKTNGQYVVRCLPAAPEGAEVCALWCIAGAAMRED